MTRTLIEPRTWMTKARKKSGLSRRELAVKAECSEELIYMMEEFGCITYPNIAARIAHVLMTSVEQYNDMVHKSHHADSVPKSKPAPKIKNMDRNSLGYIRYL